MRVTLFFLLLLLVVSSAIAASPAMASTATVSPGGATTGSAGTVQWSWQTARRTLNCTSSGFTATVGSVSGSLPLTIATDMTWNFGLCRIVGGTTYVFTCTPGALRVTGLTVSGVTPGSADLRCVIRLTGTCLERVTGTVPVRFDNFTGAVTLSATGQTLIGSGSTCVSLPNDVSMNLANGSGDDLDLYWTPATSVTVS